MTDDSNTQSIQNESESLRQFCPFELKAMDTYDEDLSENPFLQSLLASCPDLFSQCVLEQWLICVPRRDSLPKYAFTLEDFTHHILKPILKYSKRHWSGNSSCSSAGSLLRADSSIGSSLSDHSSSFLTSNISSGATEPEGKSGLKGNWNYVTLSHTNVEYSGQNLILDVEVPIQNTENNNDSANVNTYVQLRKEVLFDETFYTNDRQRYKVLCVASPLNSKVELEDEAAEKSGLGLWNLTSLRDCIDFIWVKGNLKILETYDAYTKLFLHNHPALESLPLGIQRNLVNTLYLNCLEYAEGTGMAAINDNAALSDFILQRLKLATETYVLNGVYRPLISAITSATAGEDAFLNKITRNLSELHPQDLDIDPLYWNILSRARYELSRISSYSSPLGKLSCMKRTLRYLRITPITEKGDNPVLGTDELIPIWVYLVVKTPLGNWTAQLEFLRQFRFSSAERSDNENSFYVVTLEASLEHLKSGKVLGIPETECDTGTPCDLGEAWLYSLHQEVFESDNPQFAEMVEMIRVGNGQGLEELVEEYEVERYERNKQRKQPKEIDGSLLCHPLCVCPKCSVLCASVDEEKPMIRAVDLTTEDSLTLLHIACIYGRPKLVDQLIGTGASLEAKDSNGNTPLHLSASRGHQNALLLLLHAGADLEAKNNTLNTALHLAAQNGHEACVKALVYYSEHVRKKLNLSARNGKGDTPLHFASRWGFIGIVRILTEHGAAITLANVSHATPIDCAHDIHILKLLQTSLRRRSLVQLNHGDYVNIEMMQKEDSGGIVMLISEPQESQTPPEDCAKTIENASEISRAVSTVNNSRIASRRNSLEQLPTLLLPGPTARSRRVSQYSPTEGGDRHSTRNPMDDSMTPTETEKCLINVVEQLKEDPASPDFVLNYIEDYYDPTEQDHVRKISVEALNGVNGEYTFSGLSQLEINRDRDIRKLFTAISVRDIPLALFYLGIPAEEIDNPENECMAITIIPSCHPLCPCMKCVANNAGLRLGLDIKNSEGLAPIHMACQDHLLVLVKILIRYGADINLQSELEKKTALDMAMDRGYADIEDVLLISGARPSTSFCPAPASPECEK